MAGLTTKTKFVNIVIRKKNFDIKSIHDKLLNWCNSCCENYAFIYHMCDINLVGEVEDPHLHLVCVLKSSQRLSTTLNSLCANLYLTTLGIMIDKTNSLEGSIQYLLHKNDTQKTPHKIDEVYHNYDIKEFETIINSVSDSLTAQRLYDIIRHAKSNYDIINAIGLSRYCQLRNVIKDIKEDICFKNKGIHNVLQKEAK